MAFGLIVASTFGYKKAGLIMALAGFDLLIGVLIIAALLSS